MKNFSIRVLTFCLVLFTFTINAQEKEYNSVQEAIMATGKLAGKGAPRSLNWINGGDKYSYTASGNEIRSYDPSTGKDELVFSTKDLSFPDTNAAFSYRSFQWAKDSKHLVFQSNFRPIYRRSGISDYYIYSLDDKTLTEAAKDARTAELSPDGSMVGIERNGNMFVYSFDDNKENQLTNDAEGNIFNGHYDWVYEEEFGQAQAWNWSPDNQYIAYWHFDESGVPIFQMTNYEDFHPDYVKIPVPLVGDPNPSVKIGIVDVKTNKNIWVTTDETGDYYIPRIYWTSEPGVLAVVTLNRSQNDFKLYFFDVKTGKHKLVMEEKSDTWIDVYDFYAGVGDMITFPEGTKEFFWISDRDGWQHLYRYDYNGKLINQVTKGNWTVTKVHGINPETKTVYFESTEVSPLERRLYSIKFDGSDKQRLTGEPGLHKFNLSPNTKYYLDSYSNVNTPRQVELWNTDGEMISKLEDNKSVKDYVENHKYSPRELFSFKTSDGVNIDCYMIKPFDFDSTKKYPVVFAIYGGPGSQAVYNAFETNGFHQYLAQEGYIVVDVNNRGTANYGSDFMKIVYKQLGKWESNDFEETAKYLSAKSYVDPEKMAIMGTSYGGYISAYTITTHPDVFKVGIANSPVTDWRLYDDIYTERYMGLLNENKDGYVQSATMTHADSLQGKLLLVHSAMDDNVHIGNTMQLLTALTNAGKDADLRIYPPGAHGAAYNFPSYILINQIYFQYLERYLKGKCELPNLNKD